MSRYPWILITAVALGCGPSKDECYAQGVSDCSDGLGSLPPGDRDACVAAYTSGRLDEGCGGGAGDTGGSSSSSSY